MATSKVDHQAQPSGTQSNHDETPRPSPTKKPKPTPRHRNSIRADDQLQSAASHTVVAPQASSSTQAISSKKGSLKSSAPDQAKTSAQPLSRKRKRSSPSTQHARGPTLNVKQPATVPMSIANRRTPPDDDAAIGSHLQEARKQQGRTSTSIHQGQITSRPAVKREESSSGDSSPPSSDVEIIPSASNSKGKAKAAVSPAPPSKHQSADQQPDQLQLPPTAKRHHTTTSRDGSESATAAASQTSSTARPKKASCEPAQPSSSKSAAITYTTTEFTPPGQTTPTFRVRWCSNRAGPHYLSILATDATKKRVPPLTKPEDLPRSGTVSAYVALDPSADIYKRWMRELGSELADFLNLDEVTNKFHWLLEDLPSGYRLIERLEGIAGRPSRTVMLCGSKFASTFYSARRELVKHLMNLINAGGACPCQNCLDRTKRHGGTVHLPDVSEKTPASKNAPVLGAVDGPMHNLRRALEAQHRGFTWSPARGFHKIDSLSQKKKDSVKANAEGAESFKLKKRATGYGGPYVDPHQSEDIERALSTPSSWVRMKEVVWYKLPRPIRSPRLKNSPIITHWPAVVCERKTVSRPKLAGPMPLPAKSFDGTLHNEQFTEWHVRLLGCCDFVWSTRQELLPFLAYKPFTQSFSNIKPDEKSFGRVWDSAAERPIWPPVNALGSLEEAYVPFAVALQHASYMMRKVVLCDPFAFRVSDPELANSKLSGGKHNESVRNWSAPKVCHFQGAFIGAERVWVGDLLRLRITKPSKALVPLHGDVVDPALFVDNHGVKPRALQTNSLHSGKERRDAPEQLLQNRCLLILLNSIWQHPTTDRVFVSGFVYELKKKSSRDEPAEAPDVPQDMPPLPPAPPGYHFCLLVPLPAEHSFEIES